MDVVKALLDKGANSKLKNNCGSTALDIAEISGNKEMENLLLVYAKKRPSNELIDTDSQLALQSQEGCSSPSKKLRLIS